MKAGGVQFGARREAQAEVWAASFGPGHTFVLASWRAVLAAILRGMEEAGEVAHIGDLRQLVGLCEKMDTEAFQPFRPEELTAIDHPRRNLQLGQIAYDVGEALIADGICNTRKLTPSSGLGYYGRYLRAGETVFFLGFDSAAWAAHKLTPLWVRFDQAAPSEVLAAIRRTNAVAEDVPVIVERDRRILLPLFVEPGVERPQIVQHVAFQTATILDAVHRLVPTSALPPVPETLS